MVRCYMLHIHHKRRMYNLILKCYVDVVNSVYPMTPIPAPYVGSDATFYTYHKRIDVQFVSQELWVILTICPVR